MSVQTRSKLHELTGLVLVAASILLILSMVSYQPLDPSLNVSAQEREYANYGGKVGAWVSDVLLQVLGLAAFCLPFPLFFIGYKEIRSRPLHYPFLKLFGFFSTLLALSAGVTLLSSRLPEITHFTPGGVLGVLLAERLLQYLNGPGSLLIVLTVLLLSLVLTTRFSVDAILTWIGQLNWNVFSVVANYFHRWRKRRRAKKQLKKIRQKKTWMAQPIPRKTAIESPSPIQEVELAPPPEGESDANPSIGITRPPAQEWGSVSSEDRVQPLPLPQLTKPHELPSLDFLQAPQEETSIDESELMSQAQKLATKCTEFDVHGRVLQIHPGPVVTTFEFKPDPGVKYSRITNLADDLCLGLRAESVRIDRIPGKNTVGIEVPNRSRQVIHLREILASTAFQESTSPLTLGLGKLINGSSYVTRMESMPHLLIAGATGSGKSVALNAMVCSILYKASPLEVRFIMIDPKRLELGVYEGIPHLLTPIVTDPKQASNALDWAVNEMEERYRVLAHHGLRNIDQYNQLVESDPAELAEDEPASLPYILIIVDELADLMMIVGKEVEGSLTRLAQMARAIGIHLILATQRPSVDVLTGLIKANFPARISFRVSSKVDSRTVIDSNGAEQLLGQGDMLFLPPGTSRLVRIHGAYISEKEIKHITQFLKSQAEPEYREEVLSAQEETESSLVDVGDLHDDLYQEAARFVAETGRASTSLLQRRLRVGYGRAARLLDMMEHEGIIGPPEGSKPREILVPPDYFEQD